MDTKLKNSPAKWEKIVRISSPLVLSAVLTLLGLFIPSSIEQSRIRYEYVHIATDLLSRKVDPHDDSQKAIRQWAADVLKTYSPVEMSTNQVNDLITGAARTLPSIPYGGRDFGYDYDDGYNYLK